MAADSVEGEFNRQFRERRLAARRRSVPFLTYPDARKNFDNAMAQRNGTPVDLRFWDSVFKPMWISPERDS
jgi:hypothetical protein